MPARASPTTARRSAAKLFTQADGSLHEAAGAVDLAAATGALPEQRATELLALALRVRAMLRGLLRPTARGR